MPAPTASTPPPSTPPAFLQQAELRAALLEHFHRFSTRVQGRILTAASIGNGALKLTLPAKSVVMLELQ